MSFAFVQKTSNTGTASTSGAVTLTTTAGNLVWLIAAAINAVDTGVPTWSSSDTVQTPFSRNDITNMYLSSSVVNPAGGGSTTYTATWNSATNWAIAALEYSGQAASSSIGNQFSSATLDSSPTSGSLFVFSAAMVLASNTNDAVQTYTNTSGTFTERVNITGTIPLSITDRFISSGSQQGTWSLPNPADWQGIINGYSQFVPPPTKPFMLNDFVPL